MTPITRIGFGAFAFALVTLGCDPADEPMSDEELLAEDDEDVDALAANPADDEELDEAEGEAEATIIDGPLPAPSGTSMVCQASPVVSAAVDTTIGSSSSTFTRAGLPRTRRACRVAG